MRVFLSYRRDDSSGHAGRLADALVQEFGPKNVFQDVAAIGPGRDFASAIEDALGDSEVVLVVIGPKWLAASGPSGKARLHEPGDYVRTELATALSLDVPVVPVLINGAKLPTVAELPDELGPLAHRQAVVLRDESWRRDVDALLKSLRGEPEIPAPRRRRWLTAGVATGVAMVVIGGAAWRLQSGGDDFTPPPECEIRDDSWTTPSLPPQVVATAVDEGSVGFEVATWHHRPTGSNEWEVQLDTLLKNRRSDDSVTHGEWNYELVVDLVTFDDQSCFSTSNDGTVGPQNDGPATVGFIVDQDPNLSVTLEAEEGDDETTIVLVSN